MCEKYEYQNIAIMRREQAQARELERILERYKLEPTSSKQVADILDPDSNNARPWKYRFKNKCSLVILTQFSRKK